MRLDRLWFALPFALLSTACGDEPPPSAPTPAPASFVRMDIDGPLEHYVGAPGDAVQLRAIASFSDGTRPDVTNEATWTVVDARVVTVSRGVVTGLADGGTIVTASYRGWSSATNVRVARALGPRHPVSGVVRDAGTGTHIVDATIRDGQGLFVTRTDGNGFFETHVAGPASFTVGQFGYADASLALPDVTAPTTMDVRLMPNPGAYVERTVEGEFDTYEGLSASATLTVSTRAGGIFDAVVAARGCDYNGWMQITASSGGQAFVGRSDQCVGRLRFVVPDSQIRLTIIGHKSVGYRLTFREPR